MHKGTCKMCGGAFWESTPGARGEAICDDCEMRRMVRSVAGPYIASAKAGDTLRVTPCTNPAGWWTVLRNERPIHHFPDKEYAEALCYAIAKAEGRANG